MKKILVVGVGSIGRRHIENFSSLPFEIDIAEINKERITKACDDFNINKSYEDYAVALEDNDYDAVAITVPPFMHLPVAKAALSKNCHVFIEKPLGMSVDGWNEISDICKEKKLINYVSFNHRHIPYVKRLKKILDSGKYGKVLNANMRWGSYLPDWHPWEDYRSFYMAKKEQGGGALLDESHGIDLIRYLLGEPERVAAFVGNVSDLEITSDDVAFLTMELENGPYVQINFDLLSRYPRVSLEIVLSEGSIYMDRIDHVLRVYDAKSKEWTEERWSKEEFMSMYPVQAKHFFDCISNNTQSLTDIDDGIKTQRVIDMSFKSSETNSFQKISH